jgi:hypothetical protein
VPPAVNDAHPTAPDGLFDQVVADSVTGVHPAPGPPTSKLKVDKVIAETHRRQKPDREGGRSDSKQKAVSSKRSRRITGPDRLLLTAFC